LTEDISGLVSKKVQVLRRVFDSFAQEYDLLNEKISHSGSDLEGIQMLVKLGAALISAEKALDRAIRTVYFAQEIKEIKKKIAKIPPDVIHKYLYGNNEDSCNLN